MPPSSDAGEAVENVAREAYALFMTENGLGLRVFPSLRRMESDVVAMVAGLLGGDASVRGSMTARRWSVGRVRKPPGIHLMLTPVHAPIVDDYLADLAAAVATVRAGTGIPSPSPRGLLTRYRCLGQIARGSRIKSGKGGSEPPVLSDSVPASRYCPCVSWYASIVLAEGSTIQ